MMKRIARPALAAVAFLSFVTPAVAKEGGLPQLNPEWFASQVFWLAVHFIALYIIAAKLILPRLAKSLGNREQRISGDIEQADRLQKQATEARTSYEKALAEARTSAQAVREQTLAQAAADQAKAEQKLAEELAQKAVAANEKIAQASAAVRGHIRDVAAEASAEIVAKLTGSTADKAAIDTALSRLLDAQLKEVA